MSRRSVLTVSTVGSVLMKGVPAEAEMMALYAAEGMGSSIDQSRGGTSSAGLTSL